LAIEFDDAQVDLRVAAVAGDGEVGLRVFVVVVQPVVPERGEHVAVHHEERFGQVVDEGERADGAERLVFARVIDADAPLAAVAEVGHEQLGEVAGGQCNVIEAGAS
jgi:hypothetical protein